ncbi:MAG: hypothetical protein IJU20_04585 [Clostridia bacterium]|nr:hypothetical protein [Clostridia bacterium]
MERGNKAWKKTIRALTFSSVMAALSVVLLFIGGFLEMLDMTMAAVAGVLVLISVIEAPAGWQWALFAASAALSLILMPYNFAGWSYLFVFGYYPILRAKINVHIGRRAVRILVKLGICLVSGFAMYAILKWFLGGMEDPIWIQLLLLAAYVLIFGIYDLLLGRLALLYVHRLQDKLKMRLK